MSRTNITIEEEALRVTIIGAGYVGLVTGACLSETGNTVMCVDTDAAKIQRLAAGKIPFHEPGLAPLVERNLAAGRLLFTTDLQAAIHHARVIFVAVGTPPRPNGEADLVAVEEVARAIGTHMDGPKVVVTKSTVPVGTACRVKTLIGDRTVHRFSVVANPEFLKEGAAVQDFMSPDRVILGGDDLDAIAVLRELYAPFMRREDRVFVMDAPSAELTKYAANAMLAMRISFMNEIAALCAKIGANAHDVRRGVGADSRIGTAFLFPGTGFGGSCFPKDLTALLHLGERCGVDLRTIQATLEVNRIQKRILLHRAQREFGEYLDGRVFAVWGLAFKPGTDDVREAPATDLIEGLLARGAQVRATDPVALERGRELFGERVVLDQDSYKILEGADGLFLVTEWNEYRFPDFERIYRLLRKPMLFDGRNIWNRRLVESLGFTYHGIGV
jgi:UDPglucose 6-dehydrogenase